MSIEKTWWAITEAQDDDLKSLLQQPVLSGLTSHNPLGKLKKNLLINMIWATIICLFYIAIIVYFHIWQVQAAIGLVLLFSLWALYTAYLQYRQLNTTLSSTGPVLDEMKRHYQSITIWMKTQQYVALLIYPLSAAGGFMLGGVLGSGKSVEVFMGKPVVIIALIITIAILVPACYYLAKWMCKYSFGKHLDALKENINALEEEK